MTGLALVRGLRHFKYPVDISKRPTRRCREIRGWTSKVEAEKWRTMQHELEPKCYCNEAQPSKDKETVSEEGWWFRFILFTFGAVPQTIKSSAVRGAPWIQLTGMSYAMSYLVTEIIDKLAGEYDLQDHLSLPITAGTLRQFLYGPEIVGG